jgi:hypothetical protein
LDVAFGLDARARCTAEAAAVVLTPPILDPAAPRFPSRSGREVKYLSWKKRVGGGFSGCALEPAWNAQLVEKREKGVLLLSGQVREHHVHYRHCNAVRSSGGAVATLVVRNLMPFGAERLPICSIYVWCLALYTIQRVERAPRS